MHYKQILLILILFTVKTVKGQDFIGYYVTPKVSNGFFITKIAIYADSTFYWNFSGDLIYEERNGKYIIENDQLIFDLRPDLDTIQEYYKDLELGNNDTTTLPPLNPIIYDKNEYLNKRYLIRKNKLIPISKEGKPIRKSKLIRVSKNDWERKRGMGIYRN